MASTSPPSNRNFFKASNRNTYEATMQHDAIPGARYMDTVFSSEFTVVAVRADTDNDVADNDEVTVVLDYEKKFDDLVEVSLSQFRDESGIYVIEVPDHAG